jgi:hypothetical protein
VGARGSKWWLVRSRWGRCDRLTRRHPSMSSLCGSGNGFLPTYVGDDSEYISPGEELMVLLGGRGGGGNTGVQEGRNDGQSNRRPAGLLAAQSIFLTPVVAIPLFVWQVRGRGILGVGDAGIVALLLVSRFLTFGVGFVGCCFPGGSRRGVLFLPS